MIIPDLPAKASMLGTDLFAVDDGVHTYKIAWSALLALLGTVSNFQADNEEGTLILTLTNGTVFTITPHDPTKQNNLTFDDTPTEDSDNPVKSGGVYTSVHTLETAVGNLSDAEAATEQAVTGLGTRMTTAEGNISGLAGRMTTAEGNISDNATAISGEISRAQQAENTIAGTIDDLGLKVVNGRLCAVFNA